MKNKHIAVCIPTYKRVELLKKTIKSIIDQFTDDKFSYSILVVDNDNNESARPIVNEIKSDSNVDINYSCELNKNISSVRNRLIKETDGDLIAFIDDDEHVEKDWLLNMFNTMQEYNVDVVNGPVKFLYEADANTIHLCSNCFAEFKHRTGLLDYKSKFTNNCLIKRKIIELYEAPFDITYGLSGGEDTVFFNRLEKDGAKFCWCAEAVAYEHVPLERMGVKWLLKRHFRYGNVLCRLKLSDASCFFKPFLFMSKLIRTVLLILSLPLSYVVIKQFPFLFYKILFGISLNFGQLCFFTGYIYYEYK